MPLDVDDVFPGIIAYFSVNALLRHPLLRSTSASRDAKARPFVCYELDAGEAYWTYLTSSLKRGRLTIDRKHLRGPFGRFGGMGPLIIGDCRSSYVGPAAVFSELSAKCDEFKGFARPFLAPQGIAELRDAVARRGGLLPTPRRLAV